MPLVILLEASSIVDSVVYEDGTTIKAVFASAVSSLIQNLQSAVPTEKVIILRLGGGDPIHPLSNDLPSLSSALRDFTSSRSAISNVKQGLKEAFDHLASTIGSDVSVQVVLIGFSGSNGASDLTDLHFPLRCTIHPIMFNKIKMKLELEPFEKLAKKNGTKLGFFGFETDQLSYLNNILESIIRRVYQPFQAQLCIGHLQIESELQPSPTRSHWSKIAPSRGLPSSFPSTLNVAGFLPLRAIISPPSIARYLLVPCSRGIMSNTENPPETPASSLALTSSQNLSTRSLLLLMHSLHKTQRAAVVNLGEEWYGVLLSVSSFSPSPDAAHLTQSPFQSAATTTQFDGYLDDSISSLRLVLLVLDRESSIPFIGPLSHLIVEGNFNAGELILGTVKIEPAPNAMDVDQHALSVFPLPLMPSEQWPSYNPKLETPSDFVPTFGDPNSLVIEIARLQTLVLELPALRVDFFKQAERIRQMSIMYSAYGLMEAIGQELAQDAQKRAATTLTGRIILRLVDCIKQPHIPIKWSEEAEAEIEKLRERTKKARVGRKGDISGSGGDPMVTGDEE